MTTLSKIKKLDVGNVVMILAGENVVFSPKGKTEHLTLNAGRRSGVLDIHRTVRSKEGESHETLFAIQHSALEQALLEVQEGFNTALLGTVKLFDPLKMARKRIFAINGLIPAGNELQELGSSKGGRFSIDRDKLLRQISPPKEISRVLEISDGKSYVLFSCSRNGRWRRLGSGFNFTDAVGKRHAAWIPDGLFRNAYQQIEMMFRDAFDKHDLDTDNLPPFIATQRVSARPVQPNTKGSD